MRICFFNHYHNGDILHSKQFVKQIIENYDAEYYYAHPNNPAIIRDLKVTSAQPINIDNKVQIAKAPDDTLFINTWIGAYFGHVDEYDGECTLRFAYGMYSKIFNTLNEILGTNLKLDPIADYVPVIDYSQYEIEQVDNFLSPRSITEKRVLFSNGPCYSGQCDYPGDMQPIIIELAQKHKDVLFIATQKFVTDLNNIKFTSDIIQTSYGSDMNEISYLANYCDILVGRNSGPDCFNKTQDNLFDETKTFYTFGNRETDNFCHGLDLPCNYIFYKYESIDRVISDLDNLILFSRI